MFRIRLIPIFILFLILWAPTAVKAEKKWFVSVYGGQISKNRLTNVVFEPQFANSSIIAFAAGRELIRHQDLYALELEGQFVKHSGPGKYPCDDPSCGDPGWGWGPGQSYEVAQQLGWQKHEEYNLVLIFRWLKFPWNNYVNTTLAIGEGLSYADKIPPIEIDQLHVNKGEDQNLSRFLNYLMIELTMGLPKYPEWNIFYRVHHRSGDYGLIRGVSGGSNFVGFGLRYHF